MSTSSSHRFVAFVAATLLAVCTIAPTAPSQDTADDARAIVIPHSADGLRVTELIDLAETVLGHPIAYHRATVADRRVDVSGEIRCSRDDFPWIFAALLDFSGLIFSGSPSPTHPVAFVVDDGAARSVIALPRPKLSSASLGERPAHYAPLYTTVFTLERTDARALLATLQQALDPTRESARNLGDGDTLVVTASYASLVTVGAIVDAAEGGDALNAGASGDARRGR